MVDPKNNNENNKELIEALKTEYDDVEVKKGNSFGLSMKKILFYIILITILLIISFWLLSLKSSKKDVDYTKYENTMIKAAKEYYKVNKNELPQKDGVKGEVTLSKLVELKYMNEYDDLKSCSGSVTVERNNNDYNYVSYLDCGSNYSSKLFYKKITEQKNIVTSGDGLYYINNEYVYRGEVVNNYVNFGGRVWRIVKIDSSNDIVLISDAMYGYNNPWDNRYNEATNNNAGYNIYEKSRIKDFLNDIYETDKEGKSKLSEPLFTKGVAKKIKGYKACVGKRDINVTVNNNLYECQSVIENTKLGLLTVSDYMNASIDSSCKAPSSYSCQNYNYLVDKDNDWWLSTANSSNTYEAYMVNSSGRIESIITSSYGAVRPVIHLDSNTVYKSGKGTETKPYVIE